MWSVKFMTGAGIKVYHVLLTYAKTILSDNEDETKEKEIAKITLLNFTAYNELILA